MPGKCQGSLPHWLCTVWCFAVTVRFKDGTAWQLYLMHMRVRVNTSLLGITPLALDASGTSAYRHFKRMDRGLIGPKGICVEENILRCEEIFASFAFRGGGI